VVSPFSDDRGIYFEREYPIGLISDPKAWRPAAGGGSVFMVFPEVGPFRGQGLPPLAGPGKGYVLREGEVFPGLFPMAVGRYAGLAQLTLTERGGREAVVLSPGRHIAIAPKEVDGLVDSVDVKPRRLSVRGWAADTERRLVADRVLVFSGERLVAVGVPTLERRDVADAYTNAVARSGFWLSTPARLAGELRVIAAVRETASELEFSKTAAKGRRPSNPRPE
jgi:hypothetical protein